MRVSRFFPLALLGLSAVALAAPVRPPHVAVFSENGFPRYNVPSVVSPERIEKDLDAAGIPADVLDVAALADPARFNARTYDALVLPHGNVYPQAAFGNMRAFHRAGGSLILSGVPFTHPVRRERDGSWHDLGHTDAAARFGPDGIGVGGFRGGASGKATVAPGDPLGLKALGLDWGEGDRNQTLDPETLPAGSRVVPFLRVGDVPQAAMIVHDGGDFDGAVDVWTTNSLAESDLTVAYATEQLLERGAVAALAQKGRITSQQKFKAFKALDRLPRPRTYANLTLPKVTRPYPTLQPKMPPPDRHLTVADVRRIPRDEGLLLACLQGLVNRTRPRIYLVWRDDDQFWLDEMVRQGQIDDYKTVADPLSLVDTFRNEVKGAVVPDPKVYVSPSVAVSIAGIENLLVASPELAARFRLPIKEDLRGRFKDNADALRYTRTTLLPRLNPYLSICLDPPLLGSQIDYIVAAKGMAFWITGPAAQDRPGADERAEWEEVEATFAKLPLNAVVHGFWWHGFGVGIDESPGVTLGSRFGKITTVSDYTANYSVTSGVPMPALKQKPQPPAPKLDRSKVYLAITVSDGDNLVTWRDYFRRQFEDPLHGAFPIAWGMGPTLIDVSPVQARWHYEHAAPTDEIICDVSGAGYIDTTAWATALKDRDAALRSFYDLTQKYMDRMDMKTVRFMHPTVKDIAEAGQDLKRIEFFMPDYGHAGQPNYSDITYSLPTGQAVFRAATNVSAKDMAAQLRRHTGGQRPAFLNAFIVNWGLRLSDLKAMLDDLGPGYVAVTPSQLNALYREANLGR